MTTWGFRIYAIAFMVRGMNVWGSSFFTALNNGAVSAAISFLRTFVFQIVIVLILPKLIGITGVWLSIVLAEFLALFVTIGFLIAKRKKISLCITIQSHANSVLRILRIVSLTEK